MKRSLKQNIPFAFAVASLAFALCVPPVSAQTQRRRRATDPAASGAKDPKKLDEAAKKAASAARVFEQVMAAPDKSIPKELLDRAEAVAVFPGVLKAGFVLGGRGGSGLISRRTRGGWSAPAFFKMGGASFGAQIGASKTDFVLLFMNESALKGLLEDKFEIGGEASAAAGPVGRAASASTNLTLDAGILSYSRSKGLFAGLEIKGAVVNPDNNLNESVYGVKARALLEGAEQVALEDAFSGIQIFPYTLARYSRR
ncbi:MAG TPA: lipid-binding SYLF domain-containing protein [Pyrinomonadaceae bacterium]|jgi:lipid-binding SYLF domain-containing protein|nr:lipid-binding SYLF domain-containing protein [Pyrinomonadaceae bacterium]